MFGKHLATWRERIDGFLLLGVYVMAPVTVVGWLLALAVFYQGVNPLHGLIAVLSITAYAAVGNFAAFFEIAAAARLDHTASAYACCPSSS